MIIASNPLQPGSVGGYGPRRAPLPDSHGSVKRLLLHDFLSHEISGSGERELCVHPLSRYSNNFQRLSFEPPYVSVGQDNLNPQPRSLIDPDSGTFV